MVVRSMAGDVTLRPTLVSFSPEKQRHGGNIDKRTNHQHVPLSGSDGQGDI